MAAQFTPGDAGLMYSIGGACPGEEEEGTYFMFFAVT